MSKNIQIFVSCHKSGIHIPDNTLLKPIQVGTALADKAIDGMLHDDTGDNISVRNRSYCELTAQYWAWKNVDADYYGFFHYRRYFNFSDTEFPIHHEPFIFGDVVFDRNDDAALQTIDLNEQRMREIIESHDFIAPTPVEPLDDVDVYSHYEGSAGHHIEDFDTVLDIIRTRYPEIWPSAQKYLHSKAMFVCNMFVMNRDLFHKYSAFLFDVLSIHEKLSDYSHYSPVARRVSGYLGERLCGIYLTYLYDQGYNGVDLQRVYFKHTEESNPVAESGDLASTERLRGVKIADFTRGNGKLYATVHTDKKLEGLQLVAQSVTEAGDEVPAKILNVHGQHVLVLPLLLNTQTVTIKVKDVLGAVCGGTVAEIDPKKVKLRSQVNTFTHNQKALSIRNCDDEVIPEDTRVIVDHVIDDVNGDVIVQGHVSLMLREGVGAHDFVFFDTADALGRPLTRGEWTCLGDEVTPLKGVPSVLIRHIDYSIRLPHSDAFIIWARFTDSAALDGFELLDNFHTHEKRVEWRAMIEPACQADDYDTWFQLVHRTRDVELELQRTQHFAIEPKFSIIVPLYKTPIDFFVKMANSVLKQTYTNWELILVNASPEDGELKSKVAQLCRHDHRVREVLLQANQGITLNTNEGIKAATGDFLCFFDHDDILELDALYRYVAAINQHPDTDMLYCDEDKYQDGAYREPFFKTDWNPDLLLGMNYVCHFLTVRKNIMDTLDLPGNEYDGSQDYHMTFRIGEKARYVHHEPRVLYHWRVHEHSTAKRADQKDYALETSRLAIETHLERIGVRGTVEDSPLSPRRFVVKYDLGNHPLVSIIIPNKDAVAVLHQCLSAIRKKTTYDNYEIVVVENNSTDPATFAYYEALERDYPQARVVKLEGMREFNFSKIINYGVAHSNGEYVLMLNNDTKVITPDWIERLLGPCMRSDVGVTGAKLLFPDGTIQHAGISFGPDGPGHLYYGTPRMYSGNFEATLLDRDLGAVTGACLMVSRADFDAVGGMDEQLAIDYNDVDFCLAVQQLGRYCVLCPTAELYHFESVSRGAETEGEKAEHFRMERGLFMHKWPQVYSVNTAPFENPHLEFGNIYQRLHRTAHQDLW